MVKRLSDCPEAYSLGDLCDSLNFVQLIKTPILAASNASLVVDSGVEEMHICNHLQKLLAL